jgi:hypothetical protein
VEDKLHDYRNIQSVPHRAKLVEPSPIGSANATKPFKTPERPSSSSQRVQPVLRKITSGMDNPSAFPTCLVDGGKALGGRRKPTFSPKMTTAYIELSLDNLSKMANQFLEQALSRPLDGCRGCEGEQSSDRPCHLGPAPNAGGSTAKTLKRKPLDLGRWSGDEIREGYTLVEYGEGKMGDAPAGQNNSVTGSNPTNPLATQTSKSATIKRIYFSLFFN